MWRAAWCLAVLAACAPTADADRVQHARAAITGSAVAYDAQAVFALGKAGFAATCTATLVGERTLLTSARCLTGPLVPPGLMATNLTMVNWGTAIPLGAYEVHPQYVVGGLEYDLAMVQLERDPDGVTPLRYDRVGFDADAGVQMTVMGYGALSYSAGGVGGRRQVDVEVSWADAKSFQFGDEARGGLCLGDVGGPSLLGAHDAGVIVGVHVVSPIECGTGTDLRVAPLAAFIDDFLDRHQPTCARGDGCVRDCTPPDEDCACLADGVCSSLCLTPDDDPDCPNHCRTDGFCQAEGCPTPDDECLSDGALCANNADLCPGHQCLTDDMHPDAYCSRTCVNDANCRVGMRCSFGVCRYPLFPEVMLGEKCTPGMSQCHGGICVGPSAGEERCSLVCDVQRPCPSEQTCVSAPDGTNYCSSGQTNMPPPPKTGCSITVGENELSVLLLSLLLILGPKRLARALRRP